jgi:hypothetical protein
LKLSFDHLRNKNLTAPFSATIEQITRVSINSQSQIDDLGASSGASGDTGGAARSRTSASGRSNGGLLGGVTGTVNNTVGGVAPATTGAVGGVIDTTGQATGQVTGQVIATANSATGNAKGLISITSNSSVEATGSSTLSLTGKNMKIEKGAVFFLRTDKSLNLATGETP